MQRLNSDVFDARKGSVGGPGRRDSCDEMACDSDAPKAREVSRSFGDLDRQISEMEHAIKILTERLSPVISHAPTAETGCSEQTFSCEMASNIGHLGFRVRLMRQNVEYLLDQVQL